eukprot:m.162289 g.162289  ORF g.162289 m.162289 type:complete len:101 (+) comp12171_c0_seq1:932-1234(+)
MEATMVEVADVAVVAVAAGVVTVVDVVTVAVGVAVVVVARTAVAADVVLRGGTRVEEATLDSMLQTRMRFPPSETDLRPLMSLPRADSRLTHTTISPRRH